MSIEPSNQPFEPVQADSMVVSFAPESPDTMSNRELIVQIYESQRRTETLVQGFIDSMKDNPMIAAIMGRFGG